MAEPDLSGPHAGLVGWGDIAETSALWSEDYDYTGGAHHREEAEPLQGSGEKRISHGARSAFRQSTLLGTQRYRVRTPGTPGPAPAGPLA